MPDERDELISAASGAFLRAFDGVIVLAPEGAPNFWVGSGQSGEIEISEKPIETRNLAVCSWRASRQTLLRVLGSEHLLVSAFLSGRLAIEGDMSVMARLSLGAGENG